MDFGSMAMTLLGVINNVTDIRSIGSITGASPLIFATRARPFGNGSKIGLEATSTPHFIFFHYLVLCLKPVLVDLEPHIVLNSKLVLIELK